MKWFVYLIFLFSLTACQPAPHQDIRFGIAQTPLNLDPRYATDAASERVNRLLYQTLVDFDANAKPQAKIGILKPLSPTQYAYELNVSGQFHHGKPITAEDVKATYDSIRTLSNSPHAAEFANIKSINLQAENTVIFELKQADTHFAEKLTIGILPADLIAKKHDFAHNPIGSGALQFKNWQHHLTLERVADKQTITLVEVKDPTVRVLKLLRNELDLIQGDLPPELVKHLQKQPSIDVKSNVGSNFSYLGLNMQDPVLKQLKVRQAIAHAIDYKEIIAKAMVNNTRHATAILPPEHYAGNPNLTPYAYNPSLAKQLLVEAGVQLPLTLVYKTSTDAQRVRLATILQAQMAEAGINLQIKSLDWGTFFADVKAGNFQLFGLTWVGIKTPEIYAKAFGSQYFPPNGFNRGQYADVDLDKLLAAENWPAATQRIHNELPYIPLWYEGQFAAMQKNITNYSPKADGNWDDLAKIIKNNYNVLYCTHCNYWS